MESIYTKIKDMLSAYYPVFYLNSFEYDRTKQKIEGIAELLRSEDKKVRIYNWNCVEGLMEKSPDGSKYLGEEYDEPEMVLKYIYNNETKDCKDIFILEDFNNNIEEDKIKYYIRKIAEHAKYTNTHAIILSAIYKLPIELEKYVTVLNIPLPDRTDMERTLAVIERQTKKNLSVEMRNKMVDAALGMTSMEADLAFCLAAVKDGLGDNAPYTVSAEKEQIIRKSGILDFFPKNESLKDVGGMDVLKDWLFKRQMAYQKRARDWGLQEPKGLLNEERQNIFSIHLKKKGQNPDKFPLEFIGNKTEGFNGAEIEECIKEAMFAAYVANPEDPKLSASHIMEAISITVPLSTTMKEQISSLRQWAATRAKNASKNVIGNTEKKEMPILLTRPELELERSFDLKNNIENN